MKFQPKSEREVAEAGLLPLGTYDFEVQDATEKQSKKGNDMVELILRVYDAEGRARTVYDWLVDTDGGAYKIRHFADAVGMLEAYERGELRADDMVKRAGTCSIVVKKDTTGQYPDKNAVRDYLATGQEVRASTPKATASAGVMDDDEIPF